jgi:hypothetical protein
MKEVERKRRFHHYLYIKNLEEEKTHSNSENTFS